jgi:hypothetical protein
MRAWCRGKVMIVSSLPVVFPKNGYQVRAVLLLSR